MKAERYVLPLLPLAALYAAALVAHFAPRLGRWRHAAVALGCLACAAPSIVALTHEDRRARTDTRTLAFQWIDANVPAGSMIVTEPYGPEFMGVIELQAIEAEVREVVRARPDTKLYAGVGLPMYQVMPENSAPFYDLSIYDDRADLIVISSSIGSRYRKDPQRYPQHVQFYEALERTWTKVQEFDPAQGSGPRITIYRNPRLTVPWVERPDSTEGKLPRITRDMLPGSASGFYERLGFVYEAYGFARAASKIYRYGLQQREQPFEMRQPLLNGALRCQLRAGYGTEALALLDEIERQPTSPAELEYVQRLRQQLVKGGK